MCNTVRIKLQQLMFFAAKLILIMERKYFEKRMLNITNPITKPVHFFRACHKKQNKNLDSPFQ